MARFPRTHCRNPATAGPSKIPGPRLAGGFLSRRPLRSPPCPIPKRRPGRPIRTRGGRRWTPRHRRESGPPLRRSSFRTGQPRRGPDLAYRPKGAAADLSPRLDAASDEDLARALEHPNAGRPPDRPEAPHPGTSARTGRSRRAGTSPRCRSWAPRRRRSSSGRSRISSGNSKVIRPEAGRTGARGPGPPGGR